LEFQSDCLTFAIFHGQNKISVNIKNVGTIHKLLLLENVNYWIPFTEQEVNSREKFKSHFFTNFISGKIEKEKEGDLFESIKTNLKPVLTTKIQFSNEAKNVFSAGKEIWKFYYEQNHKNVNASLYDIKEFFKGRNEVGRMNSKSKNEKFNELEKNLSESLKILAKKIQPKVLEFGF